MSSTYSTNLALELIGTGDQAGNWGSTTNTNLGTLLEQAVSGYVTQGISGSDVTLAMTSGASATARNMFIQLTGSGGGNLIVPANKKLYFIYNATSTAVTVKVTGLTGVSVPVGAKVVLVCDGTDIIDATNYSSTLTVGGNLTVTNYTESVVAIGTVGASSTLALTSGTVQTATLTASVPCTFTMPTATAGKSFILRLTQAASGMTTATFSGVKWPAGAAPVVTATASAVDIFTFVAIGSVWYGNYAQAFA
jgi:hypothetical protein